jgi:DNA-binding beta-propeller fold protein YncE
VRRLHLSRLVLCLITVFISLGGFGCSQDQKSGAVKKTYSFWPPAPDSPHIQFLVSYNSSADVSPSRSKFDELLYGQATEQGITKPSGIAYWNGRIYVTDLRSIGVAVFDLRKKQARMMGVSGSGSIERPVDVSVGPDGKKYVIDSAKNSIVVFDPEEGYLYTITQRDFNPVAMCVYQNELYVSDFAGACVKVLDAASGKLLRTIGSPGTEDGHFVRPVAVKVDHEGNILVADVLKCRVQKFTRDGKLLMAFGEIGNRVGDFVRPKHMAIGKDGMIYVVDAAFNNVQVFDPLGKFVGFFGSLGDFPGSMNLPFGLWISDEDLDLFQQYVHPAFQARRLIFVSNQFGANKIAVYAEGELKPGKTVADITADRSDVKLGLETEKGSTTRPIGMGSPLPPDMFPATAPATAP